VPGELGRGATGELDDRLYGEVAGNPGLAIGVPFMPVHCRSTATPIATMSLRLEEDQPQQIKIARYVSSLNHVDVSDALSPAGPHGIARRFCAAWRAMDAVDSLCYGEPFVDARTPLSK